MAVPPTGKDSFGTFSPPLPLGALPLLQPWHTVPSVRAGTGDHQGHLLAEVEEELLEDEDGPCAAEDDERLSREEAEQGASHGSAQETLHHSLGA